MKKNFFILYLFVFCFIHNFSFSEIKDKRVWDNLYSSCIGEYNASTGFTNNEFKNYCKCTANQITKKFNVKELVLLESKITQSNSEDEEVKILLANKKMEEIVADCVSKILS
tara:strand:+ start:105 stop:440 length:336 start_codon:yes stop_codon:yes gene_type:complete